MNTIEQLQTKTALGIARAALQLITFEDDLYPMLAERKALVEIEAAIELGEGLPADSLRALLESVSRIVAHHDFELTARQLSTQAALPSTMDKVM